MAEDVVVKKSYWEYLVVVSVVLVVALVGVLWLGGYFGVQEKGFTEKKCLGLLSQFSPDVNSMNTTTFRSDGTTMKDGVLIQGSEYLLRIYFEINMYEGVLDYCRLSRFSTKSLLGSISPAIPSIDKKAFVLRCKPGDITIEYANTPEYTYVGQEIFISKKNALVFYATVANASGLENITNILSARDPTLDLGFNDSYQASILFINPEQPAVLITQIDGVVDTAKILECSGAVPDDFIKMSTYGIAVPVTVKK